MEIQAYNATSFHVILTAEERKVERRRIDRMTLDIMRDYPERVGDAPFDVVRKQVATEYRKVLRGKYAVLVREHMAAEAAKGEHIMSDDELLTALAA